jgi:hypothetical protein
MHVVRVERGIKVLIADCVSFLPLVCSFEVVIKMVWFKRGSGKASRFAGWKVLEAGAKTAKVCLQRVDGKDGIES